MIITFEWEGEKEESKTEAHAVKMIALEAKNESEIIESLKSETKEINDFVDEIVKKDQENAQSN